MINTSKIIDQIDFHFHALLSARAVFPTTRKNMLGKHRFSTAPWYQSQGYNITLALDTPLTEERRQDINQIGRWMNENYVIRLYALLHSHGLVDPIDKSINGHEEVDLLRRLRNALAHGDGSYNPQDKKNRRTYERMVEMFNLKTERAETARYFPVHIDDFLAPMTEKCKQYVRAKVCAREDKRTSR